MNFQEQWCCIIMSFTLSIVGVRWQKVPFLNHSEKGGEGLKRGMLFSTFSGRGCQSITVNEIYKPSLYISEMRFDVCIRVKSAECALSLISKKCYHVRTETFYVSYLYLIVHLWKSARIPYIWLSVDWFKWFYHSKFRYSFHAWTSTSRCSGLNHWHLTVSYLFARRKECCQIKK